MFYDKYKSNINISVKRNLMDYYNNGAVVYWIVMWIMNKDENWKSKQKNISKFFKDRK